MWDTIIGGSLAVAALVWLGADRALARRRTWDQHVAEAFALTHPSVRPIRGQQ